jgi:hypothetical protein
VLPLSCSLPRTKNAKEEKWRLEREKRMKKKGDAG